MLYMCTVGLSIFYCIDCIYNKILYTIYTEVWQLISLSLFLTLTAFFFLNRKTPKFQRLNGWDLPVGNDPLGIKR